MKPHKHCELIKAWADGAEIQRRKYASNEWVDTDPDWRVGTEYRIKPRIVKREGWVIIYKCNGGPPHAHFFIYDSFDEANKHKENAEYITTVKVEWEEEVE